MIFSVTVYEHQEYPKQETANSEEDCLLLWENRSGDPFDRIRTRCDDPMDSIEVFGVANRRTHSAYMNNRARKEHNCTLYR